MEWCKWAMPALTVAALVVAEPAAAITSARATISGLNITLYDLNPSDGIDPSLTFFDHYGFGTTAQIYSDNGEYYSSMVTVTADFGEASASMNQSIFSASVSGFVTGPVDGGWAQFEAITGIGALFTLSPWTGMTLTINVDGDVSRGPGTEGYASAETDLFASIYSPSGSELHYDYASHEASCHYLITCEGNSTSFFGMFNFGFENLSATSVTGNLYVYAYSTGYSVTPIPEPKTYLMFLAGLAAVGAVGRRRRAV